MNIVPLIVFFIVLPIIGLVNFILALLVLVQIGKKEGRGKLFLGLFVPLYAFIWGWLKSLDYNLRKIMWVWTSCQIAGIVLSLIAFMSAGYWMSDITQFSKPDISSLSLTTYDGQTYDLAQNRGKVVVINFWASWCTPCEKDVPVMERIWREYRDDNVLVIGIDYLDTESKALDFIWRFVLTYPIGSDTGTDISKAFNISGVPETFVLDKGGMIAEHIIGPVDYDQLHQIIEELLQK
jgi:cytochrome c biogenesis protein CcmG/thiol:disulfide interchange protein DsbE